MSRIALYLSGKFEFLRSRFRPFRAWFICHWWGIETAGSVRIAGPIFIRTSRNGAIKLGKRVQILSAQSLNTLCRVSSAIDSRWKGIVEIGDNVGMSSVVISCRESIKIGARTLVGANTQIFDHNFHSLNADERHDPMRSGNIRTSPVVIEEDCFIGTNCMILKGTHLGARSIVAAGSVVFGLDVPPDSLVRGNPARVEMKS